jgi:hypothetical protein
MIFRRIVPTRMQRLHAWLMPALGCFTLSVAAIGFRLNPSMPRVWIRPLELIAYSLMGIGGMLIIVGAVMEVTIPAVIWWFGRNGKLCRTLKRLIKQGVKLSGEQISFEQQKNWASDVTRALSKHSSASSPDIEKLEDLGDSSRSNYRNFTANTVLEKQIRFVQQIVRKTAYM